jgi:hypothetical protein
LLRALLLRPPVPPVLLLLLLLLLAMMVCSVARAASSWPLMTSQRGDSGSDTRDISRNTPGTNKATQGAPGSTKSLMARTVHNLVHADKPTKAHKDHNPMDM